MRAISSTELECTPRKGHRCAVVDYDEAIKRIAKPRHRLQHAVRDDRSGKHCRPSPSFDAMVLKTYEG
jgi:hypothetical protein